MSDNMQVLLVLVALGLIIVLSLIRGARLRKDIQRITTGRPLEELSGDELLALANILPLGHHLTRQINATLIHRNSSLKLEVAHKLGVLAAKIEALNNEVESET